jgi:hypothetical protein
LANTEADAVNKAKRLIKAKEVSIEKLGILGSFSGMKLSSLSDV